MEGQSSFSSLENYPDLEGIDSHMSHCLTEEVYEKLHGVETISGFTIDHVIQTGIDDFRSEDRNRQSGCVAGDEQTYEVFSAFFDDVIEAAHDGYKPGQSHVVQELINEGELVQVNFDKTNVFSATVRLVRNIQGFCFPTFCTRSERRIVERICKDALSKLKGKYHLVQKLLDDSEIKICGKSLSEFIDRSSMHTCVGRDFPDARGLWVSDDEKVVVTINCNSHVTLFSTFLEGNIVETYNAVKSQLQLLEAAITEGGNRFAVNDHLGYITTFPEDLGIGMRASIELNFPKLARNHYFEEIVRKLRLQTTQPDKEGCMIASNIDSLGFTETHVIQLIMNGLVFMEECEKRLQKTQTIDRLVNDLLPILR